MINSQIAYLANLGSQVILWALFIASFFLIASTVERLLFYRRNFLKSTEKLIKELAVLSLSQMKELLTKQKTVETTIVLDALEQTKNDTDEKFAAAVSARISSMKPSWERSFLFFSAVGSNAPFLGLLGTVLGLMQSFADLALAAKPDAAIAMAGISNALITTVAGIVIAIPSIIVLNYLKARESVAIENIGAITDIIISVSPHNEA
ncbi:MotA/TolQ/ExbB proton channel family protein [bacterium]|nr:MotA/TolQ/ExbB proton channel family protein [bacterium]